MPADNSPPELRAAPILKALENHGVVYVAVGSYAAIAQGVDLPMTDLDIVPAKDPDNARRLVAALIELGARETTGQTEEPIEDLQAYPESISDVSFRTFVTDYGELDVVQRPAGFPRGYADLVDNAVAAPVMDRVDSSLVVTGRFARVEDIYRSKQLAGRDKDRRALPAFRGIDEDDPKEALRARYRADVTARHAGHGERPMDH